MKPIAIREAGFTLIELMIAIAILGILVSIAHPAYQAYVLRTKASDGLQQLTTRKSLIADFYADNGRMPRDFNELGLQVVRGNVRNQAYARLFGIQSEIWQRVTIRPVRRAQRLEIRLISWRLSENQNRRINLYLQAKFEDGHMRFRCHVNNHRWSVAWVPGNCRSGRRSEWNW